MYRRVNSIFILVFSLLVPSLWAEWNFGPNEKVNDDTVNASQSYPSIAVAGEGNVYCVWEDWRNGQAEVYFSYRPAGGIWNKNEKVLKEIPNANPGAKIVTGEHEEVYCIFCPRYGTVERDVYFTERIGAGQWTNPIKINDDSGDNSQIEARLAIDNKGILYCIWLDSRNTGPFSKDLYFSMKPKDGNWTPNEKVNDILGGALRPCLVVDSAGNCYAVWEDLRNTSEYRDDIYFAFRPKGGSWGPNVRVNDDLDSMN